MRSPIVTCSLGSHSSNASKRTTTFPDRFKNFAQVVVKRVEKSGLAPGDRCLAFSKYSRREMSGGSLTSAIKSWLTRLLRTYEGVCMLRSSLWKYTYTGVLPCAQSQSIARDLMSGRSRKEFKR